MDQINTSSNAPLFQQPYTKKQKKIGEREADIVKRELGDASSHGSTRKLVGKRKKAAEAEDIIGQSRQILRRSSVSSISPAQLTREEEIKNKDGELWQCVSRKPNKSGGYIYIFRLRDEYDSVTVPSEERRKAAEQKIEEIRPAIELMGENVLKLDSQIPREALYNSIFHEIWEKSNQYVRLMFEDLIREKVEQAVDNYMTLKKLGYQSKKSPEGVFMELPDREALLARWEILRTKRPNLPKLNIISSEGIADDMVFVEAFFTHDVLLAKGQGFFHDHGSHVRLVLLGMLNSGGNSDPTYQEEKARMAKEISKIYRRILLAKAEIAKNPKKNEDFKVLSENITKFEMSLGALVDIITTRLDSYTTTKNIDSPTVENFMTQAWNDPYFKNEFIKKFKDGIDDSVMLNLWEQIHDIEKAFDEARKEKKAKPIE